MAAPAARTNQPVRRAKGLARMAAILDAAAEEFVRVGYDRATTNSIATCAGISPGSLYQYFSSKEDIADALALRYSETIVAKQAGAFGLTDPCKPTLLELVDLIVDPLVIFDIENPGFLALFARTDLPERLANPIEPLEEAFAERIQEILQQRNPDYDPATLAAVVEALVLLFRGLMTGIAALSPADRDRRVGETKAAITGYLQHRQIG